MLVVEAVLAVLSKTRLARADNGNKASAAVAVAEMDEARQRLEELAEDYAGGRISRAEWTAARRVSIERVEAAQHSLALPRSDAVLSGMPTNRRKLDGWWTEASLDKRRAVVKALIERVIVRPATRHQNRFDPSRIEPPVWRV